MKRSLTSLLILDGQNSINSLPYARPFTQYFLGTQEGFVKMYPWLHQQAIDEGFGNLTKTGNGLTDSCDYMSLTRSTFLGGQRFCSYLWSGDTSSRFDVLLQQISAGVSVGASGISSWTLDIGGFSGLNVDSDEVGFKIIVTILIAFVTIYRGKNYSSSGLAWVFFFLM